MTYYADAMRRAIEVFGSKDRAEDWMEKMNAELGSAPNELLNTKQGNDRVLQHLHLVEIAQTID